MQNIPAHTLLVWVSHYGYFVIFFLLAFGIVGIPVPDETLLTLVGYLSYKGDLSIVPSFIAAFSGSLCGITISYFLGRTGGVFLIEKYGPIFHMNVGRVNRIHDWLDRIGKWGLLIGYFILGVRHVVALTAGTYRIRYPVFALFAYLGGFIWSSSFIFVGYIGGKEWGRLQGRMHDVFLMGSGAIVLLAPFIYLWRKKSKHHSSGG